MPNGDEGHSRRAALDAATGETGVVVVEDGVVEGTGKRVAMERVQRGRVEPADGANRAGNCTNRPIVAA
jgi:hypothetical protein